MWYFSWILGVCLAVAVGVLNGIWYEFHTTDDPDAEDNLGDTATGDHRPG